MDPLLDAALAATRAGLNVLPPRQDGSKAPDAAEWTSRQHRRATEDEVVHMYGNGRAGLGLVCGAISGGLELFEFEGRAVEADMLEEFGDAANAAGLGPLVERITSGYAETTPSGGIHLLYRCSVTATAKLARSGDGVLIETKGEGGYVIVAPSGGAVHATGRPWELRAGGFATIATITPEERAELHRLARGFDQGPLPPPRTMRSEVRRSDEGVWSVTPWDDFAARTSWSDILEPHGWRRLFRTSAGQEHWCRPGKKAGTSATVADQGDGPTLYVFSSSTPFEVDEAVGRFHAWAVLNHGGDDKAACAALVAQGYGRRREPVAAPRMDDGDPGPSDPEAPVADSYAHLPSAFYEARPVLSHIRTAARSRLVAPDAVYGAVLARLAAVTPHTVELPPIVGAPVGLSFFAALIGPSSAGKSAAGAVAAELVPAPSHVLDGLPLGSGEGMVDVLFSMVEETDETGKLRKVKRQNRNAGIFRVDEGAVLAELGGRRGSTLLSTLRSVYTNAPIGNTNASVETRRILDGRSYVYGITMGLQPEKAGPLLADVAAGTPQRFVWLSATDPGATGDLPPWPGPLGWEPPEQASLEGYAVDSGGWRRHRLSLDPTIADEVRAERLAVMREELEQAPLDAHTTLSRLKVAGLLAILDKRCDINVEDWALAATVVATSRQVRIRVEDALEAVERRNEQAATDRHTRREVAVDVSKEERALLSGAGSAARVVARHAASREHDDGGCAQRCMARAMAGQHRALVGVEEMIAHAEKQGWIHPAGGRWVPGKTGPA